MKVSSGCRVHAMRDLSTLSKYTGCYEEWMKIVKKYQLKWKNENYNSLIHSRIFLELREEMNKAFHK
jgi:hypothetical protein